MCSRKRTTRGAETPYSDVDVEVDLDGDGDSDVGPTLDVIQPNLVKSDKGGVQVAVAVAVKDNVDERDTTDRSPRTAR